MTNFDNLNLTPEILSKLNFGVNEDTNEFFICTSEMCSRCMFKQKWNIRNMPNVEVLPLVKTISTENYKRYECNANADSRLEWLLAEPELLSGTDKLIVKHLLKRFDDVTRIMWGVRNSFNALYISDNRGVTRRVLEFDDKMGLFQNLKPDEYYNVSELGL